MKRTCSNCGRVKRVPIEQLAHRGVCARCRSSLEPIDHPLEITGGELDAIVAGASVPVLVDFWAGWCRPCRMAAPVVDEVARVSAGRALVLKVNTERNTDLIARFRIRGIPNFIVFDGGEIVRQHAGLVDHREMLGWLERPNAETVVISVDRTNGGSSEGKLASKYANVGRSLGT